MELNPAAAAAATTPTTTMSPAAVASTDVIELRMDESADIPTFPFLMHINQKASSASLCLKRRHFAMISGDSFSSCGVALAQVVLSTAGQRNWKDLPASVYFAMETGVP